MATERELKKIQEELLYELALILNTKDVKKKDALLMSLFLKSQGGMTKEEIAEAEKRAMIMIEFEKGNDS